MKSKLMLYIIVVISAFVSSIPAYAGDEGQQLFLPLAPTAGSAFGLPLGEVGSSDPANLFTIDANPTVTRLRTLSEAGEPFQCDANGTLEVHVFGPGGDGNRLDNVLIQVTPLESAPEPVRAIRATGQEGTESGVARFALWGKAEVRVLADVNGQTVESDAMLISTVPGDLPAQRLIDGRYCANDTECAAFKLTNRCAGNLHWNIVFKKRNL